MRKTLGILLSILIVSFISLCPTTACAANDDEVFTSSTTGISFLAPRSAHIGQDDLELFCLETADEQFTFTSVPFNLETTSSAIITQSITSLAQSAQLDLTKAERFETQTQTMDISVYVQDYKNKGGAMVGTATVRGSSLSFYIVLVVGPKYGNYGGIMLQTLEFGPLTLR